MSHIYIYKIQNSSFKIIDLAQPKSSFSDSNVYYNNKMFAKTSKIYFISNSRREISRFGVVNKIKTNFQLKMEAKTIPLRDDPSTGQ